MSLFVRPKKLAELERIHREHLADACRMVAGDELVALGVFGPGKPHDALAQRVGDMVLLSHEGHAMIHTPPGTTPVFMPGSHGGMSEAELRIPLFTVST